MKKKVIAVLLLVFINTFVFNVFAVGKWEKVGRDLGSQVGGGIGGFIGRQVDKIAVIGNSIVYAGRRTLENVTAAFRKLGQGLYNTVSSTTTSIGNALSSAVNSTTNAVSGVVNKSISATKSVGSKVATTTTNVVSTTSSATKGIFSGFLNSLGSVGRIAFNGIRYLFTIPMEAGKAVVLSLAEIGSAIFKVVERIVKGGILVTAATADLLGNFVKSILGIKKNYTSTPKVVYEKKVDNIRNDVVKTKTVLEGTKSVFDTAWKKFSSLVQWIDKTTTLAIIKSLKVLLTGAKKVSDTCAKFSLTVSKKLQNAINNLNKAENNLLLAKTDPTYLDKAKENLEAARIQVKEANKELVRNDKDVEKVTSETKEKLESTDSSKEFEDLNLSKDELLKLAKATSKIQDDTINLTKQVASKINTTTMKLKEESNTKTQTSNLTALYKRYLQAVEDYRSGKISKDELIKIKNEFLAEKKKVLGK